MRSLVSVALAAIVLSACGSTTTAGSTPSPIASASASPAVSPTPPAGFVCASTSGGSAATSTVAAVRAGQQTGYDRFVIEFGGGIPSFSVVLQSSTTFTRSPKGDQVTLAGTTGVLITVHSITNWTSYSGPMSFQPGYPFLREAQMVQNYEGYQQWALGLEGTGCLRVATLSSPNRLVVDIVGL